MDLKKIEELASKFTPITMNKYSNGNLNDGRVKVYELDLKTGEITVSDGAAMNGTNSKGHVKYYVVKDGCNYASFAVDDPDNEVLPYKSFNKIISPSLEGLCRVFCDITFLFNQGLTKLLESESA